MTVRPWTGLTVRPWTGQAGDGLLAAGEHWQVRLPR